MDDELQPQVTERDRHYFRRLGEFERENDERDRREHLARTLEERLHRSANLSDRTARHSHDDERPEELYERAKRLGLYRP